MLVCFYFGSIVHLYKYNVGNVWPRLGQGLTKFDPDKWCPKDRIRRTDGQTDRHNTPVKWNPYYVIYMKIMIQYNWNLYHINVKLYNTNWKGRHETLGANKKELRSSHVFKNYFSPLFNFKKNNNIKIFNYLM